LPQSVIRGLQQEANQIEDEDDEKVRVEHGAGEQRGEGKLILGKKMEAKRWGILTQRGKERRDPKRRQKKRQKDAEQRNVLSFAVTISLCRKVAPVFGPTHSTIIR
jgi:hypothetical protein